MKRTLKKILYCFWCLALACSFLLTTSAQAVVKDRRPGKQTVGMTKAARADLKGKKSKTSKGQKKAKYKPGEIIVKFKPAVEEDLETAVETGRVLVASIDKLNKKHKVKKAKAVFVERRGKRTSQARSEFAAKSKETEKRFPRNTKSVLANIKAPDLTNTYRLNMADANADIEEVAREYAKDPNVVYAQPNYIYEAQMVPNDPYYSSIASWGQGYEDLWGLKKINAQQAWDLSQGSGVVVAVVDSGIDYNHPDIKSNMWTNPGEVPNNGIDDDRNGYVDDYYGFNFDKFNGNPMDDHGHGTHCAGTIAASGNNSMGVIGVAPLARVMAVKGLDATGSGYTESLANGIRYAADMGAKVISNSWGSGGRRPSDPISEDAVDYAYAKGSVVVFAAGNSSDDVAYYSPSNYAKVISVASTDHNDIRSNFSNFGNLISVSAPGGDSEDPNDALSVRYDNILSLRAGNTDMYGDGRHIVNTKYYRARGTSMAAPHVSGLAALIISRYPGISNMEVAGRIMGTADAIPFQWIGFGRINAYNALTQNSKPVLNIADVSVTEVTGNGDGLPAPGEKIKITVSLVNFWKDAGNVTATLYVNSPHISAENANSSFGSINMGQTISNSSNPYIATISPTCPFPISLTLSLVINADGNNIVKGLIVKVPNPKERQITEESYILDTPSVSGDRIVWNDLWEIFVHDIKTNTTRQITTDSSNEHYLPSISGNRVVWEDYRNGNADIYLYDLITNTERRITSNTANQTYPIISGDRIVWADDRNGNSDIYLFDIGKNVTQRITTNAADQYFPSISNDRIVWHDLRNGNADVYLYDLSTNTEKRVTTNTADQSYPIISGNRIVWEDNRNGNADVYLYDLTTNAERRITTSAANQSYPIISGDRIVWQDDRNGNLDIYVYDLRSNTEQGITQDSADQYWPYISGDYIAWVDERSPGFNIFLSDLDSEPYGSVDINNKAAATNNTLVNLILSATDPALKGISQMQFSNDGVSWSAPEAYATTKSWNLTSGDGMKTVYVKFNNTRGKWTTVPITASIMLDTIVPTMSITSPVQGATIPDNAGVLVSGTASDNFGLKFVYLDIYDITANDAVLFSGPIYPASNGTGWSTQPPAIGGIWGTIIGAVVDIVQSTALIPGHTIGIAAMPKDNAGNWGAGQTITVTVGDVTPPTAPGTPTIATGANPNNTGTYTLTWAASTDKSGIKGYDVYRSVNGGAYAKVTQVAVRSYSESALAQGKYAYKVYAVDNTGLASVPSGVLTVVVDKTAPTVSGISAVPNISGLGSLNIIWLSATISYTLGDAYIAPATQLSVTVKISNSANTLVRTLTATQAIGARSIIWDGKNSSGAILPAGTYKYVITVKDAAGNSVMSASKDIVKMVSR